MSHGESLLIIESFIFHKFEGYNEIYSMQTMSFVLPKPFFNCLSYFT